MHKILTSLFILSSILFSSASVKSATISDKEKEKIGEFFTAKIAGDSAVTFTGGKNVSLKDIESSRNTVWELWKDANAKVSDNKLIEPRPLSDEPDSEWSIPGSLEPDAVMPYRFGFKGDTIGARPLYIFLHGSGPKTHEWNAVKQLASMFDDAPSIYFIPQIPNEGQWYRWYQRGKQWAWERLLRQALLHDDVDENMVYMMGISEGAYGSQRLASFYADYLAGAGPMAGGEPFINAPMENLRNTAFTLRTGQKDYGFYRNMLTYNVGHKLDSLQNLYPGHYAHKIELIPGAGHGIDYRPTPVWLRQHKRNPYPKSVYWENYPMDGRYRDGFYNLYVDERSNEDDSLRTCYEMNINGNDIDIQVNLVKYEPSIIGNDFGFPIALDYRKTYTPAAKGRFKVYLNDRLVDMNKNVTLKVNGKIVFEGKLRPSVTDMVNSCVRYYDPARVYPASIDVDLSKI